MHAFGATDTSPASPFSFSLSSYFDLQSVENEVVEISPAVFRLLHMEHIQEEHTGMLQRLSHKDMPTTGEEWNAQHISIGFPDNSVWQSVSHDLEDLPRRAQEVITEYDLTNQQIKELEQELAEFEAKEAKWKPWQDTLKHLEQHGDTLWNTSTALAQAEIQISSKAVEEFTRHTPHDDELDDPTDPSSLMDKCTWPIILRSSGFSDAACELMHDMQETLYGDIDTSSLSMEERLDLRYLKSMVMHESVPFVHPFHERHEFNQRVHQQDEGAPIIRLQATHECVLCDCGSPAQLINLLTEWKSPLARLDWGAHGINGPRMIMIKSSELLEMFHLSPKKNAIMMKAIKSCKKKHNSQFSDE